MRRKNKAFRGCPNLVNTLACLHCERRHFRGPLLLQISTWNIEFKIMTNSVCHMHTLALATGNERPNSILRCSVETFRGKLRWLWLLLRVMLLYHNTVIDTKLMQLLRPHDKLVRIQKLMIN